MSNRLGNEASLYLRQHANNPVDWYPWGDEAFGRAQWEDRPILLSVGYSSCHWCHVMAHESFEDPAMAAQMNACFGCVKVDREERPDVDELYMQATLAMAGHGGWPMTVFLTPTGEPFFAGTYFPPVAMHGRPGFPDVLRHVRQSYDDRRANVVSTASRITDALRISSKSAPSGPVDREVVGHAITGLAMHFDPEYGGFGQAPKFPPHVVLDFLLRRVWQHPDDVHVQRMVDGTLTAMADGGIHDQLGGGFHRYSVDRTWLVPHFEKMLYDNALFAGVYSLAFQVTRDQRWREVAERTFEYLLREMRLPQSGFAASQDADSPGGEGAFFVWTPAELARILSDDEAEAVAVRYGVTDEGNFEGATILHIAAPMRAVELAVGDDAEILLTAARLRMMAARARRPAPARDDTVITAWNALAVHGFAQGSVALERPDLAAVAAQTARFLLDKLVVRGRLHRAFSNGRARHLGALEDHANLVAALLALYDATFDEQWLTEATRLAEQTVHLFMTRDGGFFATGRDAPKLIARSRDLDDHPTPSGNSQIASALLRLSRLTGERRYEQVALRALAAVSAAAVRAPHGYGAALTAIDLATAPDRRQIAIVAANRDDARELVRTARRWSPFATIVVGDGTASTLALLQDRPAVANMATAYVCTNESCSAPVHDGPALAGLLSANPSNTHGPSRPAGTP